MKILIYCPLAPMGIRIHRRTAESIFRMDWPDRADIVFGKADQRSYPDPVAANFAITAKYNQARDMALHGGYDALFTVESDMIVPPLALERMTRVDADVVYGLYVSRHGDHPWLAFMNLEIKDGNYRGTSMTSSPELCKRSWGSVVETLGMGMGCTLIRRSVLEDQPFNCGDGQVCNDWHLAMDVPTRGFRQVHDLGTVCGHIDGGTVYWPTEDGGYKKEALEWAT